MNEHLELHSGGLCEICMSDNVNVVRFVADNVNVVRFVTSDPYEYIDVCQKCLEFYLKILKNYNKGVEK